MPSYETIKTDVKTYKILYSEYSYKNIPYT
jgi:hypothetical protein